MKKIILNHKCYLNYEEINVYKSELNKLNINNYEVIIFPSVLYLMLFKDFKYKIGTQNFYGYKSGSFTGEISLEALKSINVTYTLVGHFERQKLLNENIEMSKEKLFKSLNSKFNTILFVGESKKTTRPFRYIKRQLNYYLREIESANVKCLSIAYEPNWAVGSGDIQCIDKITKVINQIKDYILKKYNLDLEVYYGGSVDEENIQDVMNVTDGIILGKSGTNIDTLKKLVNKLKNLS